MSTQYFTEEQLEKRISDSKDDLNYVQRKIIILLAASTIILVASHTTIFYLARLFEIRPLFRFDFLIFAWTTNFFAWMIWTMLRFQRALRVFLYGKPRFPTTDRDSLDEYRGLSYEIARTRRLDSIFDVLTGVQFLLIVGRFLQFFLFARY